MVLHQLGLWLLPIPAPQHIHCCKEESYHLQSFIRCSLLLNMPHLLCLTWYSRRGAPVHWDSSACKACVVTMHMCKTRRSCTYDKTGNKSASRCCVVHVMAEARAATNVPMTTVSHLVCRGHRPRQRHRQHFRPYCLLLCRADLAADQSGKLRHAQEVLHHLTPAAHAAICAVLADTIHARKHQLLVSGGTAFLYCCTASTTALPGNLGQRLCRPALTSFGSVGL